MQATGFIYSLTSLLSLCWEKLGVSAEALLSAWGLLISLLVWKSLQILLLKNNKQAQAQVTK